MIPGGAVAKNLLLLAVLVACARPVFAQPTSAHPISALEEQRYCGPPRRDAAGRIVRSH
jgi:hypothetical protein